MQYCWSLGGYLAEFSTLEEEQSVQSLLNQDIIYWIGLTDFAMEGTWRWQESHQEPSYTNWASGQPDNGVDEDCVTISGDNSFYPWHDVLCTEDYSVPWQHSIHALCQRSNSGATTPRSTTSTNPVKTTTARPTTSTTAVETTTLSTTPIETTTFYSTEIDMSNKMYLIIFR